MKSIKEKSEEYADEQDLRTWKYIVDAVLTEKEGIGQYLDSPFTEEVAKKLQKRFGNIEKKPSWSEEDERNLDWLITVCERIHYKSDPQVSPESALMLREWLKSLRPHSQWKPSDEQMKALKHASNDCSIAFADMKILATLYEQLKALHRYEQDT